MFSNAKTKATNVSQSVFHGLLAPNDLGMFVKNNIWGPIPDLLNLQLWGWGQETGIFLTKILGNANKHYPVISTKLIGRQ